MTDRRVINPWNWQSEQGWAWGVDVVGPARMLHTAGQVPTDQHGAVLHPGDLRGQTTAALDNLETVLTQAGYSLADVVRIDYYTTRVDEMMQNWDVVRQRLLPAGCQAGGALLGVTQLASPDLLIEIQAVAVA